MGPPLLNSTSFRIECNRVDKTCAHKCVMQSHLKTGLSRSPSIPSTHLGEIRTEATTKNIPSSCWISSATDLGCCYKYSCPLNAVPSLVHIVSSKLPSRACKLPTSLQCDHLCSQRQTFVHGFFYSLRYIYHLLQIFLSSSRDCS